MKGPSNMFYVYVGMGSSTRTTFSSFRFHFAMYAFKLLHNMMDRVQHTGCQVAKSFFAVLFSYIYFYKKYSTVISKSIQKHSPSEYLQ